MSSLEEIVDKDCVKCGGIMCICRYDVDLLQSYNVFKCNTCSYELRERASFILNNGEISS